MKQNMEILYTHYFTNDTYDWINEAYGDEAFSIFKEVPDIELYEIEGNNPGEIDFENIKKIYLALKDISESQAAEERLWAGLCNSVFYDYLRRRWKYDEKDISDSEKDVSAILSRFFFSNGARGSYFRNSIAKYWWVGRLTYDKNNLEDNFLALKAIGSSDLNTKITEIFYNNTFASNPTILKAIINALVLYYNNKIILSEREVLRPTMQYLNAVGGAILLDALPGEEITKITVDKINDLLKGRESILAILEESVDDFEEEDEETQMSYDIPEDVPGLMFDYDYDYETPVFVCKGDRVKVLIEDLKIEKIFMVPTQKERKDMNLVESKLLGKSVGESFSIMKHKYKIIDIIGK